MPCPPALIASMLTAAEFPRSSSIIRHGCTFHAATACLRWSQSAHAVFLAAEVELTSLLRPGSTPSSATDAHGSGAAVRSFTVRIGGGAEDAVALQSVPGSSCTCALDGTVSLTLCRSVCSSPCPSSLSAFHQACEPRLCGTDSAEEECRRAMRRGREQGPSPTIGHCYSLRAQTTLWMAQVSP